MLEINIKMPFFKFFNLFYFLLLCYWVQPFSSCVAWASHCSGFSCCGAEALSMWVSVVAALRSGFVADGSVSPQHMESSWTRHGTWSPALAGRFLTIGSSGKS